MPGCPAAVVVLIEGRAAGGAEAAVTVGWAAAGCAALYMSGA